MPDKRPITDPLLEAVSSHRARPDVCEGSATNDAIKALEDALTGPDWHRTSDVKPVHAAIKAALEAGVKPWTVKSVLKDYMFPQSKAGGLV